MPDQLFTYFIEKPLDDNIYKQWELGQMMVVRLVIDIGELLKLVLKSGVGNVVGV
jgi:hypothetical protein